MREQGTGNKQQRNLKLLPVPCSLFPRILLPVPCSLFTRILLPVTCCLLPLILWISAYQTPARITLL
ncbi:MAG: hypothetical protein WCI67_10900, partial [Chloroflexales bacterium]